jgi:flagellar biosynthesis/type III secretory pathway protein FliH
MGRVVKNASLSKEPYVIGIPAGSSLAAQSNGHAAEAEIVSAPARRAPKPPPPPPQPTIDWDALRVRAASLIDAASDQAEGLLGDAGMRAKTIVEEAIAQASAVSEAAHNQGFEAGRDAGRSAADREMNEMVITMRGLVDMSRAERHKLIESAEPEIVKLAMGIAERIVHKAVDLDRDIVVEMTKAAIQRLLEREVVTVRVNPAEEGRVEVATHDGRGR